MADLANIARLALQAAKLAAPFIPGGQAGVAAVTAVTNLIDGVRPGADPATRAELDALRTRVNEHVDRTLDSLGDAPQG